MSEAIQTLYRLCGCLREQGTSEQGAQAGSPNGAEHWKAVIDLANAHYLTPALWHALAKTGHAPAKNGASGQLPDDAQAFLADALELNRARNEGIRRQGQELIGALNRADIPSVVLKGGVCLFEGHQEAFETRMMVDLDLLVPSAHLRDSFEIAKSLGYKVLSEIDPRLHHLDVIGRDGDPASIEIHKDAGMQRRILPADDVFRQAVRAEFAGTRVLIPTATHRATHNIFHSEIQAQNNYALGHIPLRYLHDLLLLRRWHEDEIDWGDVEARMARQGYGHVVPGFLYLADRLLGLPMPEAVPVTRSARRHYKWCLAQVRWPPLRACVSAVGTAMHPMRRPPVEYRFGEGSNPLILQLNRAKHLYDLFLKHRTNTLSKFLKVFGRMSKRP